MDFTEEGFAGISRPPRSVRTNTTPLPAKIYANEGVAQFVFLKGDQVCAQSYADKSGKYQDQGGLTLPRVD